MKQKHILLLACTMAATSLGLHAQDSPLLNDYCTLVETYSPDLRAARHATGAGQEARQSAHADFLPKLSGGANFNYTGNPLRLDVNLPGTDAACTFEGRDTKYGASLNLSQPLYTGGALRAGYDKARAEEAVQWFAGHPHPDILFLDIQLTDGLSFYFIEQARPESMIVFTTAYDEYAVRAFTVNSIDYLLKPIHRERLADAIQKFERLTAPRIHELNSRLDMQELIQALADRNTRRYRTRFLISGPRSLYTLNVDEVCYFYSEEKITFAVTADRRTHIIDLPLAKLKEQLDPQQFFRVNRQYILSAPCIRDIEPYFNGKVVVHVVPATDSPIQVSREKVAALKMWLNY